MIGDLQRHSVEDYKLALQKQQEAIDLQKQKQYAPGLKMVARMVTKGVNH